MVVEIKSDQFTLFPEVNITDIKKTKTLLSKYIKLKVDVEGYDAQCSEKINERFMRAKKTKDKIERAAALIIDEDVRRVVAFRFLKGNNRKATVLRFCNIMSESTVDRYIDRGIISIACTLKLWNQFNE